MKASWDCDNKDLIIAVVIAKAELAALILLSTFKFGEMNKSPS